MAVCMRYRQQTSNKNGVATFVRCTIEVKFRKRAKDKALNIACAKHMVRQCEPIHQVIESGASMHDQASDGTSPLLLTNECDDSEITDLSEDDKQDYMEHVLDIPRII